MKNHKKPGLVKETLGKLFDLTPELIIALFDFNLFS